MDAQGNQYAESLRSALTGQLVAEGSIHDERVAAAFRAVPRHEFVPLVPLQVAYADDVVLMKRDETGVVISSVSQPSVVALMLEQAGIQPGHRVLEIGSGGYNAALLSELVGPGGAVTTVDIDPEVIERARRGLASAGYDEVRVVLADGEFGSPESAPYDRILVTVTAWDIAPAWLDQLAAHGRIVVPLRFRGQTRSIALDLVDGRLESRSMRLCGFVCMQGVGASYERAIFLEKDSVSLGFDTDQELVEPSDDVLRSPATQAWSGVMVDREEPLSDLNLWLASTLDQYCVLTADRPALEKRLVAPTPHWGASATIADDTLTYLSSRPTKDKNLVELGVISHGPAAIEHAERMVQQTQTFNTQHRNGPGPVLTIHPTVAPGGSDEVGPAGGVVRLRMDRPHGRLVVSWP
jgi:protein-L-isoaspartate(D-aspartate) O-methyltransferase